MTSRDEQVRDAIAAQASEWFVVNDETPLVGEDSAALVAWLKASPQHVEEFLGVAGVARDLHAAGADAAYSIDALLARARAEEPAGPSAARTFAAIVRAPLRTWGFAVLTAAALGLLGIGVLWQLRMARQVAVQPASAAVQVQSRHGEQRTYRLADGSLLHLNTDSAVTVRYGRTERRIELEAGEAAFEVRHDADRVFRVVAGPAVVVDLGTRFDVRLRPDTAVITVVEGRVAVEPSPDVGKGGVPGLNHPPHAVEMSANQQLSVTRGRWPAEAANVDALHTTAWLHRQIVFDHERLERVAAEFNRYAAKPIEITSPELRDLEVSGVFSTDDPEEILAFLRSLEGVRVEVTASQIRVSQK